MNQLFLAMIVHDVNQFMPLRLTQHCFDFVEFWPNNISEVCHLTHELKEFYSRWSVISPPKLISKE